MATLQPRFHGLPAPPGPVSGGLAAVAPMLRAPGRGLARIFRRERHSFAELDRHLLRDIGLTPVDVALRRACR